VSPVSLQRPALGALLCALSALACGGKDDLGSLMLAISTDMYVDKDVSRVDIIVQPEHGPAQSTQVNLFPALEGQYLPGTFSIIEGSEPGEFVRVRLVARQFDRARVVREAALKVPQRRTALLTMPIQWLCDGRVRQEGQQSRSDCDEGYTCIAGSCRLDEVDEALLPSYQSEEVYGGGNATGGGSCFDTLPCFEQSEQPALDLQSCTLDTPVSDDLNVAAVLPPGGDGHCTTSACWIPLDASALSGWSPAESSNRVQLPAGLCDRVRAGTANVRTSHACPSKAPSTPTCGPWTLVGSEPGAEPDTNTNTNTQVPGPITDSTKLGAELDSLAQELALEVVRACASLTQASPPANPSPADLNNLCQLARTALAPIAPLTWYHLPARCWPDTARQLSCEAACSSSCNPGTLADRCEANSLAGTCLGSCDSRQCLGSAAKPTQCTGACDGNFSGTCQGTCLGTCSASCAAPRADGNCDGPCDGTCTGLCIGRVEGSCQGHCDGDPMLPPAPCSSGTLCLGACSTGLNSPRCGSQLGNSPCTLDGCISDCNAIGRIDSSCDPATAWLLPPAGLDTTLEAALPGSLSDLITIRDSRGRTALDEASRWRDRLSSNSNTAAGALQTAQQVVDLLTAVMNGAQSLLDAVGPARLASAPGGAPPSNGPACDLKKSPGLVPLIDDFEDGDAQLLPNDGRNGSWSISQDGTGTLTTPVPPLPADGGANGTARAMHLAGSGFSQRGASLSLELRGGAAPYDASVHRGIRFWARGTGRLRVLFMQQNLSPGHPCSTCNTAGGECGQLYSTDVFLNEGWSQVVVDWPILVPPMTLNTPFAPDQLMTIQFEAPAPDPFDVWIDDLSFD